MAEKGLIKTALHVYTHTSSKAMHVTRFAKWILLQAPINRHRLNLALT